MARRSITIEDVGKAAGVSRQTVSRVINGQTNVSVAARERVDAAIVELGYIPNPAARRMGGARSHILLALLDQGQVKQNGRTVHAGMPLDSMLLEGMRLCSQQGYHLVFETIDGAGDAGQQSVSKLLLELSPDGVILLPPLERGKALVESIRKRGMPFAPLGEHEEFGTPMPGLDDPGQGEAAALHLIERGHHQVAFVAGAGEHRQTQARLAGYRRALAGAGSRAHRHFVSEAPLDYAGAIALAKGWLMPTIRPTAVIAETAAVALAFLEVARVLGRSVPRDLSIISLEDRPSVTCVEPPITALAHNYAGHFCKACENLIEQATDEESEQPDREGLTGLQLIERASIAKAPRTV